MTLASRYFKDDASVNLARGSRISTVIEREQVLQVARLARLALTDEEVEAMQAELSEILGHCDKLSSMDLEGVEPTTHVEDLANVLRPDEPGPCLETDTALRAAPDASEGMFRAPSPQA